MTLDLTKPLRMKRGDPVELVAFFGSEEAAARYAATAVSNARQPGQTLLIAHKGIIYGWYTSDGIYNPLDRYASSVNLENYKPPVVVKSRRGVRIRNNGQATTTACLGGVEALIELTVTDGVLTDVEIVK